MTSLAARLDADLKDGMRRRDRDRVACIRQLRSKVQETVNSKGFAGAEDDALYEKTIAAYTKQLKGGIEQLVGGGEQGAALRAQYAAEIEYLSTYLPQQLDATATRQALQAILAAQPNVDPKQSGRLLGQLMKTNPGQIDPRIARQILAELLPPVSQP